MSITIENLPIIFLGIVGIGMVIVLIGILRLANEQEYHYRYTNLEENNHTGHLEDLFSFFLQEEEKKNESFREMVMDVANSNKKQAFTVADKESRTIKRVEKKKDNLNIQTEQVNYKEIIERYEMGQDIETIAKDLKKGTGEVKLIISLYARR